jgi:hypothetical protein
VVVILISLSFIAWGIDTRSVRGGGAARGVAVTVGDTDIPEALIHANQQRVEQMLVKDGGTVLPAMRADIRRQVLSEVVESQVLLQQCWHDGFRVAPQMVHDFLLNFPAFQIDGRFSRARLQQALQNLRLSEADLLEELREKLVLSSVEKGLLESSFVLPSETQLVQQYLKELRSLDYILVPLAAKVPTMQPADQALRDHYQNHLDAYQAPARIRISYIKADRLEFLKAAEKNIRPEDIEAYFEANKAQFSVGGKTQALSPVEATIRKMLAGQQAEQRFAGIKEQMIDLNYATPNSLQPISEALHLPIQEADLADSTDPLLKSDVVKAAVQQPEILTDKNNSDVMNANDNTIVILRIAHYEPKHAKPFAEVKDAVRLAVQQEMARLEVKKIAEGLLQNLRKGQSPEVAAKAAGLKVEHLKDLRREDKVVSAELKKLFFGMPLPGKQYPVVRQAAALANGDYVVAALSDVHLDKSSTVDNAAAEAALRVMLTRQWGQAEYTAYKNDLIARASIKYPKD